jgi:hypothetical protein
MNAVEDYVICVTDNVLIMVTIITVFQILLTLVSPIVELNRSCHI